MGKDLIIEAKDLHFAYDMGEKEALKGFNLEVERGSRLALVGPNGGGKSSFFLCLNGINQISSGELWVDGEKVEYSKEKLLDLRRKVGLVFQDPDDQLFSSSVFQEISFGPLNMGLGEEETVRRVNEAIDRFQISHFKDRPIHALSGGEKKQVSIADVLVMDPDIVVLDEPAAYLDPLHSNLVKGFVEELSEEGRTILISTHDVNFAYAWADQVAMVLDGQVFDFGPPAEVFRHKEKMEEAHLVKPAVLRVYDSLRSAGLIPDQDQAPRTLEDLEDLIQDQAGKPTA